MKQGRAFHVMRDALKKSPEELALARLEYGAARAATEAAWEAEKAVLGGADLDHTRERRRVRTSSRILKRTATARGLTSKGRT